MKVQQLMITDVAACAPDDGLDRAAMLMHRRGVGCVVVIDRERRVVGIVTDRDALRSSLLTGRRLREIAVRDAMTAGVHTCGPELDIGDAEDLMAEHGIARLPVVDPAGSLVGVLSLDDVAREVLRQDDLVERGEKRYKEVRAGRVGRTVARVVEARAPAARAEEAS